MDELPEAPACSQLGAGATSDEPETGAAPVLAIVVALVLLLLIRRGWHE